MSNANGANLTANNLPENKEELGRLIFWLGEIEKGFDKLALEIKIYDKELRQELDKAQLKNILQKIVNLKTN